MWSCAGVVLALVAGSCGITRDQFYPYGTGEDILLPKGHEISSPEISLNVPVKFYNENYDTIFVNNHGLLSFRIGVPSFINTEFPLPYPSIAAFYTNVDTLAVGTVYYRETNETRIITKARETITQNFPEFDDYQPTSVFIATWVDVTYGSDILNKTNTFQIAIISNSDDTFVELLYPENEIQWIQGEVKDAGFPDAKAQAGFIAEDSRFFALRGSGSHQIRNIVSWSNTHEPGRYIFRVGSIPPEENIALPDLYNQNEEYEEETKTCAQSGPSICDIQARCVDYQAGICCKCNDGYYGNGKSCRKNGIPLRVHGNILGSINGISLDSVNLQAYVVVTDGRAYTALSQCPADLGSSLQLLSVLGGVIGWLFATPIGKAKNGYQLTGSIFNHTAEIIFPNTGDVVKIRQEFFGHDVFDQISMEADIRGTIPNLSIDDNLENKEYEELYNFVGIGHLESRTSRTFINKHSKTEIHVEIVQNIFYNPCRYAPISDDDRLTSTLKVNKVNIGYESETYLVRYGTSNKIKTFDQEDPCVIGRESCEPNSYCSIDGDSYKCVCSTGFVRSQDSERCVDFDECSDRTHNCDENAYCTNNDGGFNCLCNQGYYNNGTLCIPQQSDCGGKLCDINADCIQNYGAPECNCKPDYTGNGEQCWYIKKLTCEELQDCSNLATCAFSFLTNTYSCQCNSGYLGDGYYCSAENFTITPQDNEAEYNHTFVLPNCTGYNCTCPSYYVEYLDDRGNRLCKKYFNDSIAHLVSESSSTEITCNNDDQCPPNAKCLYSTISQAYECQCPTGYEGDGFECIENVEPNCENCGKNSHCVNTSGERMCLCDIGYHGDGNVCLPNLRCDSNSDCEHNAECRYDATSGTQICQCVDDYTKDANDACVPAGHLCNGALCSKNAMCLWDATLEIDYCLCDPDFEGDGVNYCVEKGSTCDVTNDCSANGSCVSTEFTNKCICNEGFTGDGYSCNPLPTCRYFPALCDIHASCVIKNQADTCECNIGYYGNGSHCAPSPRSPGNFLITSGGMLVYQIPFKNNNDYVTPINIGYDQTAVGIDVDCHLGRVYWGDVAGNTIKSSAYNGFHFDVFLRTDLIAPEGIAIDWVSRNIYWTDSKKFSVEVANLDNKENRHVLFAKDGIMNPRGIAVHPEKGKLFWSDWDRKGPKIEWSNLDGSQREIFLDGEILSLPNSLAIDWTTDRLCYTNAGHKNIQCVNIDTREVETIASNCTYPFGLTITKDRFYWTDWKSLNVQYLDRWTQARGNISVTTSGVRLFGLTVALENCPELSNVCQYHGNCQSDQLCLPNGHGGRTCV